LIEKLKRQNGDVIEMKQPDPVQVFSPQTAYIMESLMKSVVENGTAQRAKELGRPVAGKTGTTNKARSVWFVGFTPDIVAGAYVGFDDNETLGPAESGGRASVPIWLEYMKEAVKDVPARDFTAPEGVVIKSIDATSGLLARTSDDGAAGAMPEPVFNDDGDPLPKELPKGVIAEGFLAGTEPTQSADDAPPPPLEDVEKGGLAP
jgi:penicillin-binding protein 1A